MAFIGRDILTRNTLKRKVVDIPEWGGQITLRELTGREAIQVNQGAVEISEDRKAGKFDAGKAVRWEALTVSLGWINEDGSHVLAEGDIDQLIASQPYALIERIGKEVRSVSGADKPKPVEDAKKNLTETPSEGSGSA